MIGNENVNKKCVKCGTFVDNKGVLDSIEMYGAVNCTECIRKIKADKPIGIEKLPSVRSNRIKGLTPRLCEDGAIRIGMKGKMITSNLGNQFRPPTKLDHFIITTSEKDVNGDFIQDLEIMKRIGEDCTSINVTVLFDDTDLIFPTSFARYDSAVCQCRGDGEVAFDASGKQTKCDTDLCKYFIEKKCKPNGILSVVLEDSPKVGGVHKFRTTSWNSIRNITSALDFIKSLTGGYLAGLPLVLTLQPKTTVIPGTKTPTKIYMVNIEYRGTLEEMRMHTMRIAGQQARMEGEITRMEDAARTQLLIPETGEECKDVQEEFYPDTVVV